MIDIVGIAPPARPSQPNLPKACSTPQAIAAGLYKRGKPVAIAIGVFDIGSHWQSRSTFIQLVAAPQPSAVWRAVPLMSVGVSEEHREQPCKDVASKPMHLGGPAAGRCRCLSGSNKAIRKEEFGGRIVRSAPAFNPSIPQRASSSQRKLPMVTKASESSNSKIDTVTAVTVEADNGPPCPP